MSYPYQHSQGGYGYHPQQQQTPVSNYPPQQPLDTHTPQGSYSPYQSAPIDYRHYQQIPQQGYNQFAYQPSQANVVNYELPTSTFAQYPQHPTYTQYQQTPAATPSRPVQSVPPQQRQQEQQHHVQSQSRAYVEIPLSNRQPVPSLPKSSNHHPSPQHTPRPLQQSQPSPKPQLTQKQSQTQSQAQQQPRKESLNNSQPLSNTVNQRHQVPQADIPIKRSTLQSVSIPTKTPTPTPQAHVNQQHVLLSLAEDYINAAHEIGFMAATGMEEIDQKRYYKLLATGLTCMEALLKKFKLAPRQEAILRLRYASLLFAETDNYRVAEEALSKGVALCQRYRLLDLQYSMQHLQVRMLLETNARAALKAIDGPLAEAEASKHIPWVYAFRLLKVSTHIAIGSFSDIAAAIQLLHGLASLARNQRDISVFITATAFEALLHSRNPGSDSIHQAQQAIAAARTYQLGDQAKELNPVFALLDMVDLSCSLQSNIGRQASVKMTAMHHTIDEKISTQDPNGTDNFSVPLDRKYGEDLTANTGGIFERDSKGRDRLCFSWLNCRDIYILAYFLCGVGSFLPAALDRKATPQDRTAEQYLQMALSYVNEAFKPNNTSKASVSEACQRQKWLGSMDWLIKLHLTFVACNRKDWPGAKNYVQLLRNNADTVTAISSDTCTQLTTYLDGVIYQGEGDLDGALAAFQSDILALPEDVNNRSPDISTDLRVLAAMNSILIMRDESHPQNFLCDPLISALEPLCEKSSNQNIHAALNLIKSTASSMHSILKRKQYLSNAIQYGKETNNNQILCICLTLMSEAFFKDSVGSQAEKSVMSASNMAQRWGDPMWICITSSLCSATFERQGKFQEAANSMRLAMSLSEKLPEPLKQPTTNFPGNEILFLSSR